MGFMLVVLLLMALGFLIIGIIKIMQGLGLLLGINPTGFAFASIGPVSYTHLTLPTIVGV